MNKVKIDTPNISRIQILLNRKNNLHLDGFSEPQEAPEHFTIHEVFVNAVLRQ